MLSQRLLALVWLTPAVQTRSNHYETVVLFEHLEFLYEFDVFAPLRGDRTREHEASEHLRSFRHRHYEDIYGVRPVPRDFATAWSGSGCGFDLPLVRDAVERVLTASNQVVDEVFGRLIEQSALHDPLNLTGRIN
jgi:hypothetical protein